MTGRIFSIEEFSTFDGPGARCTVFLKGCPLKCQWCHNPEGQSFDTQILRSPNGCIGCGTCIATGMTERSIQLCPMHLLRKCGQDHTPKSLVELLHPNLDMVALMGGGITFSGGEPLSQADFLTECLKLLEGKTHRALQTSGFAQPAVFEKVLQHLDYVLFDLKLMNDDQHRHYTGVSNRNILTNYQTLARSGKPFITRIPVIPGVNDTEENYRATCEFMVANGASRIELLPYNKAAGAKYRSAGKTYQVDFDPEAAPQFHEEIFQEYNIEVNVL